LRDLRTARLIILVVSCALAVLAILKRSQDQDDLAFVQEQVRRAHSPEALVPSAAVQKRLERDHRDALLRISQEERRLREVESSGPAGASLQDSIKRDVQKMLARASAMFGTDSTWSSFEDGREHEVRTALTIDRALLLVSLAGLLCGSAIWFVELKRQRTTRSESSATPH
jgi:hypothetical protein